MLGGQDRDDAVQVHIVTHVRADVREILLFGCSNCVVREEDEEFVLRQPAE